MSVIAVDLGGTKIRACLVDGAELGALESFEARSARGLAGRLPLIEERIQGLMEKAGGAVDGIALAFPGLVDGRSRRVTATNAKFDDAPSLDLVEWFESRWELPFKLENDARLACLGEWRHGAGRGRESIVTVVLGTGIGTGVVMGGRLLRGSHGQAGSLGGHFVLQVADPPRCTCGNLGCAEAVASTWALRRDLGELPREIRMRLLGDRPLDAYGYAELFESVRKDDPAASRLFDWTCKAWSAQIVSLIHAYDPEIVVITGGVVRSAELFVPRIQEYVAQYAWTPQHQVEITVADNPETSVLLGAAAYLRMDEDRGTL